MSVPTVEGKGDKGFLVQLYHAWYVRCKPHVVHFICQNTGNIYSGANSQYMYELYFYCDTMRSPFSFHCAPLILIDL